jgi:hypothetical protein
MNLLVETAKFSMSYFLTKSTRSSTPTTPPPISTLLSFNNASNPVLGTDCAGTLKAFAGGTGVGGTGLGGTGLGAGVGEEV